jgi:thiol:disulfide interchange protein
MIATTPRTARTPLLRQVFIGILLILQAALPSAVSAQDILTGNRNASTNLLAGSGDFLPVTEAFQLQPLFYEGQLILHWEIAPEYYMYRERFRVLPRAGDLPAPEFAGQGVNIYDEYFERDMEVFYGSATLTLDLAGVSDAFAVRVDSQGCADAGLCYPPHSDYLWVDPVAGSIDTMTQEAYLAGATGVAAATPWLPLVLLLALLGGIILNLMPCVFPVLSIKVMSLARADRARLPLHGWAYTAGIISCFVLFAVALLLARAGGEAIGWGFQLQSPALIAALAYLFFILGLSLSGLISIGTRWMGTGQALTEKTGLGGSYFTGVLAAVVASPCTAPFMGAALGFALTQPALVSLSVFVALGLGMALPLLLLCYVPALARRLLGFAPQREPTLHPADLTLLGVGDVEAQLTDRAVLAALAGDVAHLDGLQVVHRHVLREADVHRSG